jgi:hypothetical protein
MNPIAISKNIKGKQKNIERAPTVVITTSDLRESVLCKF